MDPDRGQDASRPLPDTRQELTTWVRETIPVPDYLHDLLLEAVDRIFVRHEQLWQASKQDAMRAMSQGFADQLARLKHQLAAKDATVSNLSEYFENLVSSLSEKAGRDAKTNLLNFPRFEEALVILLATERRVSRCAVGLIDIANFKWYNDTCGHMVGDRIIETVSMLLRSTCATGIWWRRSRMPTITRCTRVSAATSSVFSSRISRTSSRSARSAAGSAKP